MVLGRHAGTCLWIAAIACAGCSRPTAAVDGPATTPRPAAAPAVRSATAADDSRVAVESPLARLLRQLDRDGDGRVSRGEQTDAARRTFQAMDVDRDGQVTPVEMDAVRRNLYGDARTATAIAEVDSDHDGRVSAVEHAAATAIAFDQVDTDHDGFLTLQDLERAEASARAQR